MLLKLLASVFERAKSKLTSARPMDRTASGGFRSESDNEFDGPKMERRFSCGASTARQQPRSSLSKWLCTSPPSINKPVSSTSKPHKVRRSSSWRSLKERGNYYFGQLTSRTRSVDELHQTSKYNPKSHSLRQRRRQQHPRDFARSPIMTLTSPSKKSSGSNSIRGSRADASRSLSATARHFDRLSSTLVNYAENDAQSLPAAPSSSKSHRRNKQQIFARNNTSSGGGDSGYSEDSFATTTFSSHTRPLHTSCPHCHCEQRSSFHNYKRAMTKASSSSTDSTTSDTTRNKKFHSPDMYFRFLEQKQSLSASRSYPHIKPLPKANVTQPSHEQAQHHKRAKTFAAKRRRHLSCDSPLYSKAHAQPATNITSSPVTFQNNSAALQRHFTTIGMLTHDRSSSYSSKTLPSLPKNTQVFGELNLAAIELDSLRTIEYQRPSFSSSSYSSSLTSSCSSIATDRPSPKPRRHRKGTYLVWHEYKNSSLLSATNGTKVFSVVRGDQVRLLRRIGKSTLLVQKEGDGSIGFLPQACLAHDQINSFLSVKGLRETVL